MIAKSIAAVMGLVAATALVVVAVLLAGGGHGWGAPLAISLLSVIVLPIGAALAVPRETDHKGQGAVALLAILVVGDVTLWAATMHQGVEYFDRALLHLFPLVLLWSVIWGATHVCLCAVVAWQSRKRFAMRELFRMITIVCVLCLLAATAYKTLWERRAQLQIEMGAINN